MASQTKRPDPAVAPGETKAATSPFFMSEGVRGDLEFYGKAMDPVTGNQLEYDRETGGVTVTDRLTGEITEL